MQSYIDLISKFPVLLLIFLAASSGVTGDILAKYWAADHKLSYFLLALVFYAGSGFFFTPTLLREGLVVTSILWTIINVIGFLVVGLVMFKETLNLWQIMGVGLGVMSLILLNIETH